MKTRIFFAVALLLLNMLNNADAQANRSMSNLIAPTAINQSLLPNSSNTKDLGNSTLGWRDIYIANSLYLKGGVTMHAPGTGNFFTGRGAGNFSLTGTYNTGNGYYSLSSATTGYSNTATGAFALTSNATGSYNTATGISALTNNTAGAYNTATGAASLHDNDEGSQNTATGYYSLFSNQNGSGNTSTGSFSMNTNTTGYSNTATGNLALYSNTTGFYNTATGSAALYNNTTGAYNTGSGTEAMRYTTTGGKNAAFGWQALYNNTTGEKNTASGIFALRTNSSGYENTAVGASADVLWSFLHNATAIGANAVVDASNKVRIGNTLVTSIGGQVGWTTFSDGRYKKEIKENIPGLDFINGLRPVSYKVDIQNLANHLNKGGKITDESKGLAAADNEAAAIVHDGFVAQEVEQTAKKLGFEFSGVDKPTAEDGLYGLRYDNFVVPLVKAVQELSKQNETLFKKVDWLESIIRSFSDNTSPASTNTIITDATLEQNVPNPFTGITSIRYSLPQKFNHAQLVIADMNGRRIKQLTLSKGGNGMVNIDASMLSSGAYRYSLVVDGKLIDTKQMEHHK